MRHTLIAALLLASTSAFAFEPGTHGEAFEDEGYFVGCSEGEGGLSCEIHARGAIFLAYPGGPSEPEALKTLQTFAQGAPVKFTGDEISMGDVTIEYALNTVAANPDDPLAPLVADLQGDWKANGKMLAVTGMEWSEADGRSYLISLGVGCSDGADRGGIHISLYEMGGDPFQSICLQVVAYSKAQVVLVNAETGDLLTLDR